MKQDVLRLEKKSGRGRKAVWIYDGNPGSGQAAPDHSFFMSCWMMKGRLVTTLCSFPDISLVQ
jgi:hypothetical protein